MVSIIILFSRRLIILFDYDNIHCWYIFAVSELYKSCFHTSSLMQLQQKSFCSLLPILFSLPYLDCNNLFVATLNLNVLGIYIAQTIGCCGIFVFLANYILENMTSHLTSILKGMLFVSLPLVGSSVFSVLINVTDRYMLRILAISLMSDLFIRI